MSTPVETPTIAQFEDDVKAQILKTHLRYPEEFKTLTEFMVALSEDVVLPWALVVIIHPSDCVQTSHTHSCKIDEVLTHARGGYKPYSKVWCGEYDRLEVVSEAVVNLQQTPAEQKRNTVVYITFENEQDMVRLFMEHHGLIAGDKPDGSPGDDMIRVIHAAQVDLTTNYTEEEKAEARRKLVKKFTLGLKESWLYIKRMSCLPETMRNMHLEVIHKFKPPGSLDYRNETARYMAQTTELQRLTEFARATLTTDLNVLEFVEEMVKTCPDANEIKCYIESFNGVPGDVDLRLSIGWLRIVIALKFSQLTPAETLHKYCWMERDRVRRYLKTLPDAQQIKMFGEFPEPLGGLLYRLSMQNVEEQLKKEAEEKEMKV